MSSDSVLTSLSQKFKFEIIVGIFPITKTASWKPKMFVINKKFPLQIAST